jgi:hypothetical protein
MAEKALFVSSSYIKQFTILNQNISDDKVTLSIEQAQRKYILPILGKPLYDFLVTSIVQNNGTSGLPPNYLDLLENYIVPGLTSYTIYESTLLISFQFNNKGVARHNDQFLEASDLEQLKYLRGELRNNSEWELRRLGNYLKENSSKFPEYEQETFDLAPQKASFFSGIRFDKNRKRLVGLYSDEPKNGGNIIY